MRVTIYILFVLSVSLYVHAFKFLLVFHTAAKSLNILGEVFTKNLLDAGHEVTFITYFPTKIQNKRLREIDISSNYASFKAICIETDCRSEKDLLRISYIMENNIIGSDLLMLQHLAIELALTTFNHEDVREILENPNEQFDAVIVDLKESELYAALSVLYDCPMIWIYSLGPHWHVLRLVDEATNAAYSPLYISKNVPPFTFKQRVEELWNQIRWNFNKWWTIMPLEVYHYEQIFKPLLEKRGRVLPPYDDVIYNTSLILSNSIQAIGNIPALPANFKMVGGFHIDPFPKPLPTNLQAVMDNATHGVIYFSMGSLWHAKFLPNSVKDTVIKMFGELKETVIWKYEEDLPNLPDNLHIIKWAPQTSILSHPKCLFFITHGGLLSSTEAIHFGVPIIGIPIYFDQFLNINTAVENGYALKVDLTYDLANNLKTAINTMLGDQKYKQKVKELSKIYHDRPLPPGKELVYWTEHVVRTGGAPHLRSPALHVPMYQKLYLDLGTVVVVALVTMFLTMKILVKKLKVIHKKSNSSTKKNN